MAGTSIGRASALARSAWRKATPFASRDGPPRKNLCCSWIASFTRCILNSVQSLDSGRRRGARPGNADPSRAQLTNRRMRTFITRPKAKKTKAVADPP